MSMSSIHLNCSQTDVFHNFPPLAKGLKLNITRKSRVVVIEAASDET